MKFDQDAVGFEIEDTGIKELIFKYSFANIVLSESLLQYYDNGFRTPEDIRHEDSLRISKEELETAKNDLKISSRNLKLATFGILASILLGIYSINVSTNSDIKLEASQMSTIENLDFKLSKIDSVVRNSELLNISVEKTDTLIGQEFRGEILLEMKKIRYELRKIRKYYYRN